MKRLVILSVAGGDGGAERSIEILLAHAPAGLHITVYAAHPEHLARLAALARTHGALRVRRLDAGHSVTARRLAALRLAADLARRQPDAVLVNTLAGARLAAMAAKLLPGLGPRCHLYVHDFLWRDLDGILARLAGARLIVPHPVVARRTGYLHPFYLDADDALSYAVVPAPVELPSGPVRHDGPILHLATVNPWKGHAELLLAAARLDATPLAIHSAGSTADAAQLRRLAALQARLGVPDARFALLGYVPDPVPLLRTCRAVVVPSVSHSGGPETFSRALVEAWAWRKPVIAYAAGAPAALIEHGVDGLLVPEGDVAALAAALARLAAAPDLARRLGAAGHAKAAARFAAPTVAAQFFHTLGLTPA